ncbi:MAG: ABC transporter ATP-binding protein [Chloroflexi bacterium]|nr:ABC transporter ATP-binding protein [Chloroflexota bacterium]|tara:strand:- start:291 stop:1340 length:1050 start_codon:yes stop_codon:yes gene_type:complete
MSNLIKVDNVSKVFGEGMFSRSQTVAVKDVTLEIPEKNPKIIAIAGESGSGKTTMARLILGMVTATRGSVEFQGKDISKMNKAEKLTFRKSVQAVFQDPFEVYNPFYKVDHIMIRPIKNFDLTRDKDEAQTMIEESLEMVGLRPGETLGRFPHQLSGGQRQRLMVARAMLLKPQVMVADEPVSMVDASLRATILETIQQLNKDLGVGVLYITHDLTTAYQICDDIYVMNKGEVVESGDVEKVIKNPTHPYTKLLMDSIPQPNPEIRWKEEGPEYDKFLSDLAEFSVEEDSEFSQTSTLESVMILISVLLGTLAIILLLMISVADGKSDASAGFNEGGGGDLTDMDGFSG